VEAYLKVMHAHEMMTKMSEAMSKPMHQMIHEQYLKDKDKLPVDFEERMNKELDDLMKNMPMDEMVQAMVPSYQKHFTQRDIDALVAFYSSTTGQKVLDELPAIMAEGMQNMMPVMNKYLAGVKERLEQQAAELAQKSSGPPAKDAPTTPN
jgi:hypothetical protein